MSLAGKTAVVLGGSGHYGAEVSRMLAGEGVRVALGGRSREKLEDLEAEIRTAGGEALIVGTHLAKRHHAAHLVEAAMEAFGGVDILLFMARASAPPLASPDLDAWERSVDVNVKGFLFCLASALPVMRSGGGGGHVVGLHASDSRDPLYEAGTAAVRSLLRGLVRELSGEGIRSTEVRLGDPRIADPESCARAVRQALIGPPGEGLRTFTVGEGGTGVEERMEG